MRKRKCLIPILQLLSMAAPILSDAQNPVIRDQFTADPSARVFNGRVYLYPSHDIPCGTSQGIIGFCMADYHVYSSENLTDWTDHGIIINQNNIGWVDSTSYSMWAPDCIYRNGSYYFYFPAKARDTTSGRGFSIGVSVSDKPYGPFSPQSEPIKNVHGIDPNVFIDTDARLPARRDTLAGGPDGQGQAYIYWARRNIYMARLKENMLELASEPQVIEGLPESGLKEGPWLFERNGIYYLTYPHVQNKTERLEYAMGDSPMGPFRFAGVIMDESPTGCWTNHQSIVEFNDQWYLFYHHHDYSPQYDKNRSTRIDSLFFNGDGTIRKVTPTLRGVGVTDASQRIEIDRFSCISDTGASIAFLDTLNRFDGWKTILAAQNAWIQYNAVDFGSKKYKKVQVRASSQSGSTVQVRLDKADGPILSEIKIPEGPGWITIASRLLIYKPGIHDLVIVNAGIHPLEIDWIRFE